MGAFLKGSSDPRMEEAASRFSATSSHDAKSLRPVPAERKEPQVVFVCLSSREQPSAR